MDELRPSACQEICPRPCRRGLCDKSFAQGTIVSHDNTESLDDRLILSSCLLSSLFNISTSSFLTLDTPRCRLAFRLAEGPHSTTGCFFEFSVKISVMRCSTVEAKAGTFESVFLSHALFQHCQMNLAQRREAFCSIHNYHP